MDDRVLAAVVATGLVVSNRVTVGELSKVAINDTVTLKFLADPNSAFEPEDADKTRLNSQKSMLNRSWADLRDSETDFCPELPRNAQNGKRLRGLEGERIVPVPPLAIPRVKGTQVVRGVLGTT